MRNIALLTGVAAATATSCTEQKSSEQPNVIIILADDLGYSDVGCYGSEISTPVLDKMADEGLRLTQMYNASRSCPSRANLISGLYPHQAGMGDMDGPRPEWPVGYNGFKADADNVTIAEVLREAGYFTAMVGKWHLGAASKASPVDRGFDEYYGLLGGFNSCWNPKAYVRLPEGRSEREYAKGEYYATDALTDYALDFIDQANSEQKPLFLYLAYNAPHFPLHAPKEVTDKYYETYLKGWDVIRDERWQRMLAMDLLEGNPTMSPRGEVPESQFIDATYELPAWVSLPHDVQCDLARRMAVFAAMVDVMDQNIGRVVDKLKATGEYENSFIIFVSDNGACAEWHEYGFDGKTGKSHTTHRGAELDKMGLDGSYIHYGTGWANVGSTPFVLYKHYAHEGGISTPCIIRYGDNVANRGGIDHTPTQFVDIMTTCCELAQCDYPTTFEGREITPSPGLSLMPLLEGERMADRYIYNEHEGNRMVRHGDWKAVSANYRGDVWELYNIKEDRTEQHDLAAQYPDMVAELERAYFEWAKSSNVLYSPEVINTYFSKRPKDYPEYELGKRGY